MSKKKLPTKGEKIMTRYFNTRCHSGDIEKAIDRSIHAAVRAAVKEAWEAGKRYRYLELGDYAGADYIVEEIEKKYGVKL